MIVLSPKRRNNHIVNTKTPSIHSSCQYKCYKHIHYSQQLTHVSETTPRIDLFKSQKFGKKWSEQNHNYKRSTCDSSAYVRHSKNCDINLENSIGKRNRPYSLTLTALSLSLSLECGEKTLLMAENQLPFFPMFLALPFLPERDKKEHLRIYRCQ